MAAEILKHNVNQWTFICKYLHGEAPLSKEYVFANIGRLYEVYVSKYSLGDTRDLINVLLEKPSTAEFYTKMFVQRHECNNQHF